MVRQLGWTTAACLAIAGLGLGCGSEENEEPTCEPVQGAPLEVEAETWTWVEIEGNRCRDGSPTGIGVFRRPEASRLVIYLQGGGACFNVTSCSTNPASFGADDFAALTFSGILDTSDPANPFADASFVYIPYCTGDVHGGSAEGVTITRGPENQSFVGYQNVTRALERIVPTFAGVEQIVLTGESAGGYGAWINYDQVARSFCSEDVVLLADSAPPSPAPHLATCLQQRWQTLWNLGAALPTECTDCSPETGSVSHVVGHLADAYPEGRFGLIASTRDETMSMFFAFGVDDCAALGAGFPPVSEGLAAYSAGLDALLEEEFAGRSNLTSFVIDTTQHTFLSSSLHTATAAGTPLVEWVQRLAEGPTPASVRDPEPAL